MSNLAGPVNRIARRDNGQSRELQCESWRSSAMPVMTRADCENTAPSLPLFASFIDAFSLHGASYCNLLHAIVTSPVESSPIETEVEKPSVRERRRSPAPGASSKSPGTRAELEEDINRAGFRSEAPPEDSGLAEFCSSDSLACRSNRPNWLTRPCSSIASRWTRWRREREIKKAVAALVALDDPTLRDIGIPHQSHVEQLVRYCFDC
jgi:hypothetical protein